MIIPSQIPNAKTVFHTIYRDMRTLESHIGDWLDREVFEAIMNAKPTLTESRPPMIKGNVSVQVPQVYYDDKKNFELHTKETLVSLGYSVQFGDDGYGEHDICYITWKA
ncbi:MAG: hypothetical protein RL662_2364 [Bacteroidota bacterium]|jgi:hypothetical protein